VWRNWLGRGCGPVVRQIKEAWWWEMKMGIAWHILVEICRVELKNDLFIGLNPDCRPQTDVIPQNSFWCFKERISSGSEPDGKFQFLTSKWSSLCCRPCYGQGVRRRPFTTEVRVRSQAGGTLCLDEVSLGQGFLRTLHFPLPVAFRQRSKLIHLSLTLCNFSNWQRH